VIRADFVLRHAGQLATMVPSGADPLGRVRDGALAARGGVVVWIGRDADLESVVALDGDLLDAQGGCVIPGLVDAHTHPVFSGARADEFAERFLRLGFFNVLVVDTPKRVGVAGPVGVDPPGPHRVDQRRQLGGEHDGLVRHDELDWAPLGLGEGSFFDLMTARRGAVADELGAVAARRIKAGDWPWSFFCYPEDRPRPVFPSSFFLLAPGDGSIGLAVRCPACSSVSVNVVSAAHVDLPFHNDARVGVVRHLFADDALRTLDAFRAEALKPNADWFVLAKTSDDTGSGSQGAGRA